MNSKYLCGLLALSSLSTANADVLGQWTFNVTSNATRLQSSSVPAGAMVSSLAINPSHDSAGVNAVPNTVNDGYGFGGNSDELVMFFHRAEYFNSTPDTDNGGIRPVGRVTTWDSLDTTVEGAPISFTVSADAISTLTIDSLDVHMVSGAGLIAAVQVAGSSRGATVTFGPTETANLLLDAPVVIQPGQSVTFTMFANSGALNSGHNLNEFTLNGTVSRDTTIPPVAQWNFNDNNSTVENALKSSSVASGAMVSGLAINPSHDSAGLEAVPNSVNDGYGFGGNAGEAVMFLSRAEYFNSTPDTDNGGIRPVGRVTTWDSLDTTVEGAPFSFTVSADAISTLTINSLNIHMVAGDGFITAVQVAGSPRGATQVFGGGETATLALNAPVVIQPGQTATFTIYANSGRLNSGHYLNEFSLNGTVSRNTTIPPIAQWTFDNTGSGTTEERMPVALGASSVASGLTVTPLNINTSFGFAGFSNVPPVLNDGYGFGGNSSQLVMFFRRANYFNSTPDTSADPPGIRPVGAVTTWGTAGTPGVTTVANAPLSFTVTTDLLTTLTLNSLNIAAVGSPGYQIQFQEAGATPGAVPAFSATSSTGVLNSPVVIGPGQSKTFTINVNSGALGNSVNFNTVILNGSTSTADNTYATWAAANAGNQSAELDFDNDGTANGIEFFMGETGSGFTAPPTLVNRLITWQRDPSATVASFKVQISYTLGSWTDVVPPDANLDLSDPNEVRYTLPVGEPRIFSRLVVTP